MICCKLVEVIWILLALSHSSIFFDKWKQLILHVQ